MIQKESPYLAGQLLLAMPQMSDPRFQKSVILMVKHDAQGAMGIMLNQKLPSLKFAGLLGQFEIEIPPPRKEIMLAMPVYNGGPVETERGFLIHSRDFLTQETTHVTRDILISTTLSALKAFAQGRGPQKAKFALGYAGWGSGQLEREIQENGWIAVKPTETVIMDTPPELMWEQAFNTIGVRPHMLSQTHGHA